MRPGGRSRARVGRLSGRTTVKRWGRGRNRRGRVGVGGRLRRLRRLSCRRGPRLRTARGCPRSSPDQWIRRWILTTFRVGGAGCRRPVARTSESRRSSPTAPRISHWVSGVGQRVRNRPRPSGGRVWPRGWSVLLRARNRNRRSQLARSRRRSQVRTVRLMSCPRGGSPTSGPSGGAGGLSGRPIRAAMTVPAGCGGGNGPMSSWPIFSPKRWSRTSRQPLTPPARTFCPPTRTSARHLTTTRVATGFHPRVKQAIEAP